MTIRGKLRIWRDRIAWRWAMLRWRAFFPWIETPGALPPPPKIARDPEPLVFPTVRRVVFPLFEVEPLMPEIPLTQVVNVQPMSLPWDGTLPFDVNEKPTAYIAHDP